MMEINKLRTAVGLILSTSLSNRQIGRELDTAYNTIRRYRQLIHESAFSLDDLQSITEEALQAKFQGRAQRDLSKRVPDWLHIHRELQRKGVTRTLLWMEYKEEDPATAYELSRFNELYVEWAGRQALSMRQQHDPGERGWADFSGTTMLWVDPTTGEDHHVEVFVTAVGISGLLFALAVPSQRQEHWIHAHCEWYSFLGGVPKITVPDNLKSAVLKPGREPRLNPAYLDMGRHYNTYILPARSGKPKDKSKVEGSVLIFLRWGIARLRNRVFHSLAELNRAIAESVDQINNRVIRRLQQSRRERFEAIDRPYLQPLPDRYAYGEWEGPLRVPPDYHIAIKGHFYSVPYRFVQQQVHARCTSTTVEFVCDGARVASHLRSEKVGEKTTDQAHMPEHHLAWANHTPERYRQWAQGLGSQVQAVIDTLLANVRHPAGALNACASLQKLCRTHGQDRFVLACAKALGIQSPTVKSIRSILQNHLERRTDWRGEQRQLPQHGNVRGASYYQNSGASHAD
jgi:transposase